MEYLQKIIRGDFEAQAKADSEKAVSKVDKMTDEEIDKRAKLMLARIGLNLEDLRGRTLDLGSGPNILERAALKQNANVVSFDTNDFRFSKRKDLKGRVVGDAVELPFTDASFDRIISMGAAPPFLGDFGEEPETLAIMNEMLRVLRQGGEARITPGVFAFIHNSSDRLEHLKKSWSEMTEDERTEYQRISEAAKRRSFEYLQGKGYNMEWRKEEKYDYWLLRNSKSKFDAAGHKANILRGLIGL
ncbi:MAG: class I SAM-dependent methyltransferase [Parcubacteria group bacterium]|jgi:SAM-dependent methyltransferase